MPDRCRCTCHTGPYAACSEPGGCGHLHPENSAAAGIADLVETSPALPIGYRCRRRVRCAERVSVRVTMTEPRTGKQTTRRLGHAGAALSTYDGLCPACTRAVAAAVRGLGLDYAELEQALGRLGRSPSDWTTTSVASSAAPPAPIALALEALQRDLVSHATRWAQIIADVHQLPMPAPPEWAVHEVAEATVAVRTRGQRRLYDLGDRARARVLAAARTHLTTTGDYSGRLQAGRMPVRLGHAMRLLTVDELLALPTQALTAWRDEHPTLIYADGITAGLTLLGLHEQVRAVCGRNELVHRLPARCPDCRRYTLVRENGKSHVECTHCHRHVKESGYSFLARVLADQARRERPDLARATA